MDQHKLHRRHTAWHKQNFSQKWLKVCVASSTVHAPYAFLNAQINSSCHHFPLAQAGENAPWLAGEAMRMASEVAGRFWETATWAVRRRGRGKWGKWGKLEWQKMGKNHEKSMGKTMRPWVSPCFSPWEKL